MAKAGIYSYEEIQRYLQHKMDAKEMYAFERAMMDDPFLADAIEGYRKSNMAVAASHLTEIEKQLTGDKQKAKVVALQAQATGWWKIAAIILLIVTGAAISYSLLNTSGVDDSSTRQTAQKESQEIPAVKDSIKPVDNVMPLQKTLPGKESLSYKKNTSPFIRRDPEILPPTVQTIHAEKDSTIAAMEEHEEKAMLSAMPAGAQKDEANVAARKYLSVNTPPKELEGRVVETTAAVRSEALAKKATQKRDTNVLSDAVVVGSGTQMQRDVAGSISKQEKGQSSSEPEGGWNNFDNYIKREIQSFKDSTNGTSNKTITLEFLIDEEGHPTDIQIKGDADKAVADTAIQILQNGPRWFRSKDQQRVKITIAF
jgi:hypothetical protein